MVMYFKLETESMKNSVSVCDLLVYPYLYPYFSLSLSLKKYMYYMGAMGGWSDRFLNEFWSE